MAEKQALPDPIRIKDGQIILHKTRFRKPHYSAGKINKVWYAILKVSRGVRKKISTQTTNLQEAKEIAKEKFAEYKYLNSRGYSISKTILIMAKNLFKRTNLHLKDEIKLKVGRCIKAKLRTFGLEYLERKELMK